MRRLPYLKRNHRSGNWVYFRRYPAEVQPALGRQFFERSLRTPDLKKILAVWTDANAEFEACVTAALGHGRGSDQTAPVASIPQRWFNTTMRVNPGGYGDTESVLTTEPHRVRSAVSRWADAERFRRAQAILNDPSYREDYTSFEAECRTVGACGHERNWLIWCPPLMKLTVEIIERSGIQIPPMHQSFFPIQQMVEAEFRKLLEDEGRWRRFDFAGMPETPPNQTQSDDLAPNGLAFIAFSSLIEQYIDHTRKPRKTASKLRLVNRYLENLHGGPVPLNEITKALLLKLQADAKNLPARLSQKERELTLQKIVSTTADDITRGRLTPQAIRSWFNLLGGCFNWGISADLLSKNPTAGIKPKISRLDERQRSPFSDEDLRLFFSHREYPHFSKKHPSKFWLPILAIFTGARLNELGQLTRSDIVIGPTPYIRITDQSDDRMIYKRLKNAASRRDVPIHPKLMDIGFLEFVKSTENRHVFYDLPHPTSAEDYEPTKAYSQYFGRLLKKLELKTSSKTFHSFRHTFIDAARSARLDSRVISQIVGHETAPQLRELLGSPTTARYGTGNDMVRLAEEISRINFEVNFPKFQA